MIRSCPNKGLAPYHAANTTRIINFIEINVASKGIYPLKGGNKESWLFS